MGATRVCCWQLHFSEGKKSRPEERHGNKLCSNTTQKHGKRVSKPDRAGYEFRSGARIPQGLPRPGHGIAAMSKAMPSARATATAAAHFPKDRHHAAPSSRSRKPEVIYASRYQERSLRSALFLYPSYLRCGRMVDFVSLPVGSSPLGSVLSP